MARPPPRRASRTALVLAASLAAHGLVFQAVATQSFRLATPFAAYDTPATPLTLAPPVLHPSRKPPPPAARRGLRLHVSPQLAAQSAALAGPSPLQIPEPADLAPALSLPSPDAAAVDLTDQTPPQPRYPINPGYWQVVEHWPLISRTERYCVEPWNIVRFLAEPCNHIYHCRYPVREIGADTVRFKGVITGRQTRIDVDGGGDYTPTTLRLSVSGLGHWKILPLIFSASLQGQFLGSDCPAAAKRIQQRD